MMARLRGTSERKGPLRGRTQPSTSHLSYTVFGVTTIMRISLSLSQTRDSVIEAPVISSEKDKGDPVFVFDRNTWAGVPKASGACKLEEGVGTLAGNCFEGQTTVALSETVTVVIDVRYVEHSIVYAVRIQDIFHPDFTTIFTYMAALCEED